MSIRLHNKAVFYFVVTKTIGLFAFVICAAIFVLIKLTATDRHASDYSFIQARTSLFFNTISSTTFFFAALLFVAVQWVYCYLLANSYSIGLRKEGISLKYGVLGNSNELLLFSKIQDIAISQGVLEGMLGVSTVTIHNSFGKPERILGLSIDVAEKLREAVLGHITRS